MSITGTTTLGGGLTASTGSGPITFGGAVDGGSALAANSTGSNDVRGGGRRHHAAGQPDDERRRHETLTTGIVKTSGTQTYGDDVTLGAERHADQQRHGCRGQHHIGGQGR